MTEVPVPDESKRPTKSPTPGTWVGGAYWLSDTEIEELRASARRIHKQAKGRFVHLRQNELDKPAL